MTWQVVQILDALVSHLAQLSATIAMIEVKTSFLPGLLSIPVTYRSTMFPIGASNAAAKPG